MKQTRERQSWRHRNTAATTGNGEEYLLGKYISLKYGYITEINQNLPYRMDGQNPAGTIFEKQLAKNSQVRYLFFT